MGDPGHLAPAELGAGEEGVRHVAEALPEDDGRVRRVGEGQVPTVQ